jgi:hypothetical protein
MFKSSLQLKDPKPLLNKEKSTLSRTLNNYEIIRDKVVNDFQPKGPVNISNTKDKQVKPTEKKKLLDF